MADKLNSLEQFKAEQELREYYDKRRGEGYYQDVVFIRRGSTRTKPDVFTKRESYSFLQFIRVIMKWATVHSDLTRPHVELLLYLQPLGIFKKTDFKYFCKIVDIGKNKVFTEFLEAGWIKEWRSAKPTKGQAALYCLTPRANQLCTRIHKMCIGEESIPETELSNPMASSKKPIDKYYMQIIKNMNKDRK